MMKLSSLFLQRVFAALLVTVCFAAFAGTTALAQSTGTGTINGTVTDASHAIIPGASVKVTETDTGIIHALVSNGDGIYVAPFLQPGNYMVDFSASGFGGVKRTGLVLAVGETLTVDASLPPPSVTTQVLVSTETPLLDTDKTEASQSVDQQIISNLPSTAGVGTTSSCLHPMLRRTAPAA